MICLICRQEKDRILFPEKGPICIFCIEVMANLYDVPYAPPERITVDFAYLNLVIAIRELAVEDKKLREWEDYWLREKRWKLVWMLLNENDNLLLLNSPVNGVV